MTFAEDSIMVPKGTRLLTRRWGADSPRAEIVIVHGFAEHSGRYTALAEHLVAHSYNVTGYDQRGHGQSDGLPGHIDRFATYEDDLNCLIGTIRAKSGLDVVLIGHSMGGLVALKYLSRFGGNVRAAVISAPLLGFSVQAPAHKVMIGRIAARLAPRFRMTNEIDPAVLSRDPAVGQAYAADPLVGNMVSARWFVETSRAMSEVFSAASQIANPILIMHGTEDRLAGLQPTKRVFERVGSTDKQLAVYQGYYHELFNEPEKKELYKKTTDWLETRVAKLNCM